MPKLHWQTSRGVELAYSHQREAWDATARDEHVVVVTPTASGKSLCYHVPVIEAVRRERAKVLYRFPTKALAQDQVAELLELNRAGELGVRAFTLTCTSAAKAQATGISHTLVPGVLRFSGSGFSGFTRCSIVLVVRP